MNEKAENTRAKICGMDKERWQAAKAQSTAHRTRGKVKAKRPMASLWDEVEGQESLFGTSAENADGGQ